MIIKNIALHISSILLEPKIKRGNVGNVVYFHCGSDDVHVYGPKYFVHEVVWCAETRLYTICGQGMNRSRRSAEVTSSLFSLTPMCTVYGYVSLDDSCWPQRPSKVVSCIRRRGL
jgi:hypothetical protein